MSETLAYRHSAGTGTDKLVEPFSALALLKSLGSWAWKLPISRPTVANRPLVFQAIRQPRFLDILEYAALRSDLVANLTARTCLRYRMMLGTLKSQQPI